MTKLANWLRRYYPEARYFQIVPRRRKLAELIDEAVDSAERFSGGWDA